MWLGRQPGLCNEQRKRKEDLFQNGTGPNTTHHLQLLITVNVQFPPFRLLSSAYAPFTLDVEKTAGSTADVTVYQLKGKLSLETVAGFIPRMRQESARRVVLDMSGVNFLDPREWARWFRLFVSRRNQGKTFALAALTPQATAVVTVAGFAEATAGGENRRRSLRRRIVALRELGQAGR